MREPEVADNVSPPDAMQTSCTYELTIHFAVPHCGRVAEVDINDDETQ